MTPAALSRFIKEQRLSRAKAAAVLDISVDRLRRMLLGGARIPRHIALACAAIHAGLQPYT